jgi:hypothetical protein
MKLFSSYVKLTKCGKSDYEGGKKYCRRYEVYFLHDGVFCPWCGMALRVSHTARKDKEKIK